jgi:hypothetical protein
VRPALAVASALEADGLASEAGHLVEIERRVEHRGPAEPARLGLEPASR